jgi:hypothetical protein
VGVEAPLGWNVAGDGLGRDRLGDRHPKQYKPKHLREIIPMGYVYKAGDHVSWNSEAGHVQGTIKKKVTSAIKFKTYIVHASKEEPQYLIKSDKTGHMAMHKGAALTKISQRIRSPRKESNTKNE